MAGTTMLSGRAYMKHCTVIYSPDKNLLPMEKVILNAAVYAEN